MICLLTSASCHWFCCHCQSTNDVVWKLDYLAIAGLVCTSFFPPVYYAFMCTPHWRNLYLSAIVILSVATGVISLFPKFNHPTYQPLRAGVFSGMALSGIVPCFHKAAFLHPEPIAYRTTACELGMGLIYIAGAVVYAMKVPEKWLPGRFDIIGHSHQILHVLVVVGACLHYNTAWAYLTWREQESCSLS
jgi:adiponectin receptor